MAISPLTHRLNLTRLVYSVIDPKTTIPLDPSKTYITAPSDLVGNAVAGKIAHERRYVVDLFPQDDTAYIYLRIFIMRDRFTQVRVAREDTLMDNNIEVPVRVFYIDLSLDDTYFDGLGTDSSRKPNIGPLDVVPPRLAPSISGYIRDILGDGELSIGGSYTGPIHTLKIKRAANVWGAAISERRISGPFGGTAADVDAGLMAYGYDIMGNQIASAPITWFQDPRITAKLYESGGVYSVVGTYVGEIDSVTLYQNGTVIPVDILSGNINDIVDILALTPGDFTIRGHDVNGDVVTEGPLEFYIPPVITGDLYENAGVYTVVASFIGILDEVKLVNAGTEYPLTITGDQISGTVPLTAGTIAPTLTIKGYRDSIEECEDPIVLFIPPEINGRIHGTSGAYTVTGTTLGVIDSAAIVHNGVKYPVTLTGDVVTGGFGLTDVQLAQGVTIRGYDENGVEICSDYIELYIPPSAEGKYEVIGGDYVITGSADDGSIPDTVDRVAIINNGSPYPMNLSAANIITGTIGVTTDLLNYPILLRVYDVDNNILLTKTLTEYFSPEVIGELRETAGVYTINGTWKGTDTDKVYVVTSGGTRYPVTLTGNQISGTIPTSAAEIAAGLTIRSFDVSDVEIANDPISLYEPPTISGNFVLDTGNTYDVGGAVVDGSIPDEVVRVAMVHSGTDYPVTLTGNTISGTLTISAGMKTDGMTLVAYDASDNVLATIPFEQFYPPKLLNLKLVLDSSDVVTITGDMEGAIDHLTVDHLGTEYPITFSGAVINHIFLDMSHDMYADALFVRAYDSSNVELVSAPLPTSIDLHLYGHSYQITPSSSSIAVEVYWRGTNNRPYVGVKYESNDSSAGNWISKYPTETLTMNDYDIYGSYIYSNTPPGYTMDGKYVNAFINGVPSDQRNHKLSHVSLVSATSRFEVTLDYTSSILTGTYKGDPSKIEIHGGGEIIDLPFSGGSINVDVFSSLTNDVMDDPDTIVKFYSLSGDLDSETQLWIVIEKMWRAYRSFWNDPATVQVAAIFNDTNANGSMVYPRLRYTGPVAKTDVSVTPAHWRTDGRSIFTVDSSYGGSTTVYPSYSSGPANSKSTILASVYLVGSIIGGQMFLNGNVNSVITKLLVNYSSTSVELDITSGDIMYPVSLVESDFDNDAITIEAYVEDELLVNTGPVPYVAAVEYIDVFKYGNDTVWVAGGVTGYPYQTTVGEAVPQYDDKEIFDNNTFETKYFNSASGDSLTTIGDDLYINTYDATGNLRAKQLIPLRVEPDVLVVVGHLFVAINSTNKDFVTIGCRGALVRVYTPSVMDGTTYTYVGGTTSSTTTISVVPPLTTGTSTYVQLPDNQVSVVTWFTETGVGTNEYAYEFDNSTSNASSLTFSNSNFRGGTYLTIYPDGAGNFAGTVTIDPSDVNLIRYIVTRHDYLHVTGVPTGVSSRKPVPTRA